MHILGVDRVTRLGPSPRGGPEQKRINKEYKDFSPMFSVKFRDQKLRFLAFPQGPGGLGELREAGRNNFHLLTGPLG